MTDFTAVSTKPSDSAARRQSKKPSEKPPRDYLEVKVFLVVFTIAMTLMLAIETLHEDQPGPSEARQAASVRYPR